MQLLASDAPRSRLLPSPPARRADRAGARRCAGVGGLFTAVLPKGARDAVSVVALLGAALWIDWRWTLIALVGVPLLILPIIVLQRIVRRMGADARSRRPRPRPGSTRSFTASTRFSAAGSRRMRPRASNGCSGAFARRRCGRIAGSAGMGTLADFVAALGFALVLTYGGAQIAGGERTVGQFMAFFTAFALLIEPLRRLSELNGAWQTVLASLERVHALLQVAPRITQPVGPLAPVPSAARDRRAVRGTWGSPTRPNRCCGASICWPRRGRRRRWWGPRGRERPPSSRCLTRLADPQAGRITLGGRDIRADGPAGAAGPLCGGRAGQCAVRRDAARQCPDGRRCERGTAAGSA
jgi:ATP-binding cassette, subfamily B, bacterial MsbA